MMTSTSIDNILKMLFIMVVIMILSVMIITLANHFVNAPDKSVYAGCKQYCENTSIEYYSPGSYATPSQCVCKEN